MSFEELKKALNNRPQIKLLSEFPLEKGYDHEEVMDWFIHFVELFSAFEAREQALKKEFKDLIDNIPIDLEKVDGEYEAYSIGTKKQWIEWFTRYGQVLHSTPEDKSFLVVPRAQLSEHLKNFPAWDERFRYGTSFKLFASDDLDKWIEKLEELLSEGSFPPEKKVLAKGFGADKK